MSEQIEGVRIPASPFLGTLGAALSEPMLADYSDYKTALMNESGAPPPTEPHTAYPNSAKNGLRALPPRDNARNIDVTQLTAGSWLRFPLFVKGGLFPTGDAHFSQGDNECCMVVEIGATFIGRFRVLKGIATLPGVRVPVRSASRYGYVVDKQASEFGRGIPFKLQWLRSAIPPSPGHEPGEELYTGSDGVGW